MIPRMIPGVIPLNGKKKPVTLVKIVVHKKIDVQSPSQCPAIKPKITMKPVAIPIRLNKT